MINKYSCGCNSLNYVQPEVENIFSYCEMHEKETIDTFNEELKANGLIIENNKLRAKYRAY